MSVVCSPLGFLRAVKLHCSGSPWFSSMSMLMERSSRDVGCIFGVGSRGISPAALWESFIYTDAVHACADLPSCMYLVCTTAWKYHLELSSEVFFSTRHSLSSFLNKSLRVRWVWLPPLITSSNCLHQSLVSFQSCSELLLYLLKYSISFSWYRYFLGRKSSLPEIFI